MSESHDSRLKVLDPDQLLQMSKAIAAGDQESIPELVIRRGVSALFLAAQNYWAAQRFCAGERCKGPGQDSFPHERFIRDMLRRGKDRDVYTLFTNRIAADHYILNPVRIATISESLEGVFGKQHDVHLDRDAFLRSIESAEEIVEFLRSHS